MSVRRIRWPNGSAWEQEVQLESRAYVLRAQYNDRLRRWTLDILTRDEDPLIQGMAVVTDFPLLTGSTDPRLPPGALIVTDSAGDRRNDPTRNSFEPDGLRLLYFTADEVNATV